MNMKMLFLATVLLASLGSISSFDSFIGTTGYFDLSDESILAGLRKVHPIYARNGANAQVSQELFRLKIKYLVTRGAVPNPRLAPNVAYVPNIGSRCMNYGDFSVFVDVAAHQITAVVEQSHCISLQCDLPQNNVKLQRIIEAISFAKFYHVILSQLPNLGVRLLEPGYGIGPRPLGSLGPHNSLRPVGLLEPLSVRAWAQN